MSDLVLIDSFSCLPTPLQNTGKKGEQAYFEFFINNIRNENTRNAYMRDLQAFFRWCEFHGYHIEHLNPVVCGIYVEILLKGGKIAENKNTSPLSNPTVKRKVAALSRFFNWMVSKNIIATSPMQTVKGPSYVQKEGKTKILDPAEMNLFLESLDRSNPVANRDYALCVLMIYTFVRISAACAIRIRDLDLVSINPRITVMEKGRKYRILPVSAVLMEALQSHLSSCGYAHDRNRPIFAIWNRDRKQFTEKPLGRVVAYQNLQRRIKCLKGIPKISDHTFRAYGITNYLEKGGKLEGAQWLAGHNCITTTQLYDRRDQTVHGAGVNSISIRPEPQPVAV